MKRFHFPLDRVRRWRLEQLNVEELKLRQALHERQALRDAKQSVREDLARSEQDVLARPLLESTDLQSLDSFRRHVRNRLHAIETGERQSDQKVDAQRARLLEARRQFELLDRLKQKALAAWTLAESKEQEALADEMFSARSRRDS